MKNTTHRVVIINNLKSGLISQAILILKDSEGFAEDSVLREAEEIVSKYMGNAQGKIKENRKKYGIIIGILSFAFGIAGAIILGIR